VGPATTTTPSVHRSLFPHHTCSHSPAYPQRAVDDGQRAISALPSMTVRRRRKPQGMLLAGQAKHGVPFAHHAHQCAFAVWVPEPTRGEGVYPMFDYPRDISCAHLAGRLPLPAQTTPSLSTPHTLHAHRACSTHVARAHLVTHLVAQDLHDPVCSLQALLGGGLADFPGTLLRVFVIICPVQLIQHLQVVQHLAPPHCHGSAIIAAGRPAAAILGGPRLHAAAAAAAAAATPAPALLGVHHRCSHDQSALGGLSMLGAGPPELRSRKLCN